MPVTNPASNSQNNINNTNTETSHDTSTGTSAPEIVEDILESATSGGTPQNPPVPPGALNPPQEANASQPIATNHPSQSTANTWTLPSLNNIISGCLSSIQTAWESAAKKGVVILASSLSTIAGFLPAAKKDPKLLSPGSAPKALPLKASNPTKEEPRVDQKEQVASNSQNPIPSQPTASVSSPEAVPCLDPEEKAPLLSTTERLLNLVQYDGQTETLSFKKPIIIKNTKENTTEKSTPSLINQPIPPQSPKTYMGRIIQITYSLFSFITSSIKALFKKKTIIENGILVSANVYNDTKQLLHQEINKAKKDIQEVCDQIKNLNKNEQEAVSKFANQCIKELNALQEEIHAIIDTYKTKCIPIAEFDGNATKQSDIEEQQYKLKELEKNNKYACYKEMEQQLRIRLDAIQQFITSLPENLQPEISAASKNLSEYHTDLQKKCDPDRNNKSYDQIMYFIKKATFDLDENQQKYIHKLNMQDLFKELDFINTIEIQECIIDERHDTKNGLREYSIKAKPGQPILVNINPALFNQQCLGLAEDNSGAQSWLEWGIGYAVKNDIVKPDIEINALKIIIEHGYVKTIELDYAAEVSVLSFTRKYQNKYTINY